ncbi:MULTISPECIES: hypothetical protein [unclassified Variovorax]|uniref:hypothetical protein n=1 Tax=unclassified Variovorax TaxID=663243 RepID=UPI00210C4ACC|nr:MULTISPECIES: hypothetical protein [unclassified Variovorax]
MPRLGKSSGLDWRRPAATPMAQRDDQRRPGNMLGQGNAALDAIAGAVSCASEAAFSKAFKREKCMAPVAWRAAARDGVAA